MLKSADNDDAPADTDDKTLSVAFLVKLLTTVDTVFFDDHARSKVKFESALTILLSKATRGNSLFVVMIAKEPNFTFLDMLLVATLDDAPCFLPRLRKRKSLS